MSRISDFLKINGQNMPTPDSCIVNKEPLWSSNAGRTASGLYVGDIIAEKRTISFTFSLLNSEEVAMIENALNTFYTIDFVDPMKPKTRTTVECYIPTRSYPLKKIDNTGTGHYDVITLDCVER